MGAPDKVTRLLLTLPYVMVDCLGKCDPKPQCLILSRKRFKTTLRVNSWDISNVCLKCDLLGSKLIIINNANFSLQLLPNWFINININININLWIARRKCRAKSCSYKSLFLIHQRKIAARHQNYRHRITTLVKNVYGMSFDISEIILRVKSSLCSDNSLRMFMSPFKKRAEKK